MRFMDVVLLPIAPEPMRMAENARPAAAALAAAKCSFVIM